MQKLSTKDIVMIDDSVCDLWVHDSQIGRPPIQGQPEGEPGRLQIFFSVDRYSRLVMTSRLSYEEKKSEH